MCVVDGDHLSGQLALNPALIVAVLGKRLFPGEDEVGCDRLPACIVEVLGPPLRLALDRIDVREVGFSAVVPNNPEPRRAPAGPDIQASLKVSNLAGTFCGLPAALESAVLDQLRANGIERLVLELRPEPVEQQAKVLARGHRWLTMLESGEAESLKEIATREGIDNSYVSRMVNLTTLAPDIVAAILDDTLPGHITLFDLAVDPPALRDEQRARVGL